jgi:hypothetical protein
MNILALVETVALLGALIFSALQTLLLRRDQNERMRQRREEAALELHHDLAIDGEAAAAFRRLSVSLRAAGMSKYHTATWLTLSDRDREPGGMLDHSSPGNEQNYADLYRVLWFFERAYTFAKLDLVDADLLFSLAGFHIWWWNQILREVRQPTVMEKVIDLGIKAEAFAQRDNRLSNWQQRCSSDFNNAGPLRLQTTVGPSSD